MKLTKLLAFPLNEVVGILQTFSFEKVELFRTNELYLKSRDSVHVFYSRCRCAPFWFGLVSLRLSPSSVGARSWAMTRTFLPLTGVSRTQKSNFDQAEGERIHASRRWSWKVKRMSRLSRLRREREGRDQKNLPEGIVGPTKICTNERLPRLRIRDQRML